MSTVDIVMMIILLAMGVFLVIATLLQKKSNTHLSGTIAGGAETYYGKEPEVRRDVILNRLMIIVGIIFVLLVITVYVMQPDYRTGY